MRVQLSRAKGWRMPPNTLKVDRSTRWGNPWPIGASEGAVYLWSRNPSLMALGRALYERAKADAAHRAQAKAQVEEDRRDGVRAWNEGIYRFFGPRDRELLRAWVNGAPGFALAAQHGITRQRISQVVLRARKLGLKEFRGRWQRAAH